jgi:gamma-glutamyltranspeptidase
MPAVPRAQAGSHSYHVIAVDNDGTVVSGTHTIEGAAWGDGFFVEGVPLSQAGMIPWSTKPGTRRLSPLTMHFVFRDGLVFASGAISNSLVEAALQFLVNLLDYRLPLADAVTKPRFGTFPPKAENSLEIDWTRNWLSPDIGDEIVKTLTSRKISVWNKGFVDTGLGTIVAVQQNRAEPFADPPEIEATTTPFPYVVDPFGFSGAPPKLRQAR